MMTDLRHIGGALALYFGFFGVVVGVSVLGWQVFG